MSDQPWDLQALDLLQEVAGYQTTDEVIAEAEKDENDGREAYEQVMTESAEALDVIIIRARKILKTGE